MIVVFQWSTLIIATFVVILSLVFEDTLYSLYMGHMNHDLVHLQLLTTNNPHLSSSFNQALCQKSETYQNSVKAKRMSSENIVVKPNFMRISISQPTGVHAEVVTSNIIKFALEGSAIGAEVLNHVNIAVSCDDNRVQISRTPILTSNKLVRSFAILLFALSLSCRSTLLF